jgi:hypothetical protein
MTKNSRDDFEALIRRVGLSLSPAQIEQTHEGWALLEPMLDRVRSSGRDRAAEPAPVFRAAAYTQHPSGTKTP